jgi:hypothetical protein
MASKEKIINLCTNCKMPLCNFLNKPFDTFRTSQFIIGVNKYLEAVNHKFSVGMRFKMRFEVDDSPERRYPNDILTSSR